MNTQETIGSMTLTEDGVVLTSSGELSNDEEIAKRFMNLIQCAVRVQSSDPDLKVSNFKRLSVIWGDDCAYLLTISNHRIHVCKKRLSQEDDDQHPEYD